MRRSELRYTMLRGPHAQLRNHQDPSAAELDGRLDIRPLLAVDASERVANCPYPSQGEGGTGMAMAEGPMMHGDDGGGGFEGKMRDGALGCQLMSVKITDPVCRLT